MLQKLAPGLVLLLLALAPFSAWAQSWSVQAEAVLDFRLRTQFDESLGTQTAALEDPSGFMLSVGTPFHVGFGLESYKGNLVPAPGLTITLSVVALNVFVDVPVPWVKFHVGTGWGQGTFEPSRVGSGTDFSTLEKINVWEWFARVGIPLGWGLDLLVGYHESRGQFIVRHDSGNEPEVSGATFIVTTAGLNYTF